MLAWPPVGASHCGLVGWAFGAAAVRLPVLASPGPARHVCASEACQLGVTVSRVLQHCSDLASCSLSMLSLFSRWRRALLSLLLVGLILLGLSACSVSDRPSRGVLLSALGQQIQLTQTAIANGYTKAAWPVWQNAIAPLRASTERPLAAPPPNLSPPNLSRAARAARARCGRRSRRPESPSRGRAAGGPGPTPGCARTAR